MQINDLIKLSLEYNDNNNFYIKRFFDKYLNSKNKFKIENEKDQYYINIYSGKKKIAYFKIFKLFDYLNEFNTLYWEWANINSSNYNQDVKKIWEFGFNLINKNRDEDNNLNKFLKIIFLNSGLIINNNSTLSLVISLVSYILKKKIVCFKYNKSEHNFKLIYNKLDNMRNKYDDFVYSYYYSASEFKELKGNKFVNFT